MPATAWPPIETFAVIDFETTCLSPAPRVRVTEVAAVPVQCKQVVGHCASPMRSGARVPRSGVLAAPHAMAMRVHGVPGALARFMAAHEAGGSQPADGARTAPAARRERSVLATSLQPH